jgi:hypothetical protein
MDQSGWERHIEAQERSGKSVAEYCREQGLSEKALHYQRRKRRRKFVQVGGSEPIEVHLPDGVLLRVPSAEIGTVLGALRQG